MKRKRQSNGWVACTCIFFIMTCVLVEALPAKAFTLGKTYGVDNWQELEGVAITPLLNWVKAGDFVLKTGALQFEYTLDQSFLEAGQENAGRYEIDEKGFVIDQRTGRTAQYIQGLPFPDVDVFAAAAGAKIMENTKYATYRSGGHRSSSEMIWLNRNGMERSVVMGGKCFYYQTRPGGAVCNPDNLLFQIMTFVVKPMDLKGTVSMIWSYNKDKLDTAFSYVSALRKVQRVTPASRSNPSLGSDMCSDDGQLWSGKNQTMNWKLLGERRILAPFTSADEIVIEDLPDGSIRRKFPPFQIGYEVEGWKGAPWAPVDIIWSPRVVYVIEAVPKDPAYNYQRTLYYVDKTAYTIFFKEVYDSAGNHWKTLFMHTSFQKSPRGFVVNPFGVDGYCAIDGKIDHATYSRMVYTPSLETDILRLPLSKLSPSDFSLSALRQFTK
jgi:hypothetical protein